MNPEYKFALTGREHEKDILLAYPEEIYYNSPTFDYYYTKIKDLLTMPDCKIIGFSLYNDSVFLATACELYDREPIKFEYYDFQKLYQGYMKSKKSASVESMTKELGITDIKLHKSDDDAWAVIRGLQVIGEKEKISLVDTVNLLKKCNNDYHAEQAIERNRTLVEKAKNGNISAQNKIMKRFIHKLKIKNLNKNDDFTGVDAILSVVPYYNKPSQEGIYQHYKAIAEATEESHKISTLRANGLLDADACAVRMNAISAKLTQLRGERRRLSENEALDETMDAIRKMTDVIKNGPEQMDIFDEDLFDSLVEKVIAESQTRIRFRLCGGLELAEQLEVAAR